MKRIGLQIFVILLLTAGITIIRARLTSEGRALFQQFALQEGEVPLSAALGMNPPPVWIDARSRAAFEKKHISGAYLLTFDENENFEQMLFDLDKKNLFDGSRPVIVYCSSVSCQLSHEVAERLRARYSGLRVYTLHGGWR